MKGRLKIAVFAYEFPALSETFVLNQITGLLDLGHDVTVFATGPRDEPQVHSDVERYRLHARTRYPGIPDALSLRSLRAAARALRIGSPQRLAACLDVKRFGRDAASGRMLYWGACLAGAGPFDVILAHFGPVGALAAKLRAAGLISGKLATVMHGVDVSEELRKDRDAYRELFAAGDLFLPISEVWSDRLLDAGCPAHKTIVHHMGVDTKRYRFRPRRRTPEAPLDILSVGRLVEKKGIADALYAVAGLVAQGMEVRYRIVGDGPLREPLMALREELGLMEEVRFLGWKDQENVVDMMQKSDILLAPSRTTVSGDQEGIPVTLMEAMASGMIVLSTWHSGIPELVDDGVSGFLVPEGDVAALQDTLLGIAGEENDAWEEIGQAARDKVYRAFDVNNLNALLAGRFNALLEPEHFAA